MRALWLKITLGTCLLLGASTGVWAAGCDERLGPFSADQVAERLSQIRIQFSSERSLRVRAQVFGGEPVSSRPGTREVGFDVLEATRPGDRAGGGYVGVGLNGDLTLYSIKVDPEFQKAGLGSEILKSLYEVVPAGARIDFYSTNAPTERELAGLVQSIRRDLPNLDEQSLNRELSRRVQESVANGAGPVWGKILYRAGWREITVLSSWDSHLQKRMFEFFAVKPE